MKKGKPRYDFNDPENLLIVEGLARDGLDNVQIASYFGYNEQYFSTLVNSISELSKALKKGRKPLEIIVENSLYRRATGLKVTTQVRRFLETKCHCEGMDKSCPDCKGSGKIQDTDKELVTETVTELPPDTGAAALWLKQKKPDIWNKQPSKIETNQNLNISGSVPISEFVKAYFENG
jgi:DnaJ-class molecular chaperone